VEPELELNLDIPAQQMAGDKQQRVLKNALRMLQQLPLNLLLYLPVLLTQNLDYQKGKHLIPLVKNVYPDK
jgi:hypothetical protein